MRGNFHTIPLGTPFLPALATWLKATHGTSLPTVTVWLPNQPALAQLTVELGDVPLPHLRLFQAEDAPTTVTAAQLRLWAAQVSPAHAGALAALYQHHQQAAPQEASAPSLLTPLFQHLGARLQQSQKITPAQATQRLLEQTAQNTGPQVVAGFISAPVAALAFLKTLADTPAATFIFPGLPLTPAPTLASQPGAALARLLGHLNIKPEELSLFPGLTAQSPKPKVYLIEAPHALAEASTIGHLTQQAIEKNQTPVHILCPEETLRTLLALTLRSHGITAQGVPTPLAHTVAGRLFTALLGAWENPGPLTLSALTGALQFSPWLDTALWRGVAAGSWQGWAEKLAALPNETLPPGQRPQAEANFAALRAVLEEASSKKGSTFASTAKQMLTTLKPGWEELPGGAALQQWFNQTPAEAGLSPAAWAAWAVAEMELATLNDTPNPAVKLSGLLELRLLNAGTVIIAGANEGTWPGTAPGLISDAEAERLNLPGPRQQVRLTAAEWHLALHAAPHVFITRSLATLQGPTRPSRFLHNLEVTRAEAAVPLAAAATIATQPLPHPGCFVPDEQKTAAAWSPSWVEDLTTCPYRALAKRRPRLAEPQPYQADPTAADDGQGHGLWVHRWLASFWHKGHPSVANTQAATAHLVNKGRAQLAQQAPVIRRLWQPRLEAMAGAVIAEWQKHETSGRSFHQAEYRLEGSLANGQALRATADHIDASPQGWWLVDYKTGTLPSHKEMQNGKKPQLVIEAWLAENGGEQNKQQVAGVQYLKLRGHGLPLAESRAYPREALAEALTRIEPWLTQLAQRYRAGQTFPATPVYGGGLMARGHCQGCAYAGLCRWQESKVPG